MSQKLPTEKNFMTEAAEAIMDQKRPLAGINNAMPGPGAGGARGYVIVGSHLSWASPPTVLKIGDTEHDVVKEAYDYMVRGLALANGALDAIVTCEDGRSIDCVINVETVC